MERNQVATAEFLTQHRGQQHPQGD